LAKEKDKPLYVRVAERDDFSDLLSLIPDWVFGAVIWYTFSKLIIDPMVKPSAILGKPGTQLSVVLLGADIVTNLPPGVALAAQIDVFLTALEIKEDFITRTTGFIVKTLQDFGAVPKETTKPGDPRFYGEVRV
jgi:hypothetical protein